MTLAICHYPDCTDPPALSVTLGIILEMCLTHRRLVLGKRPWRHVPKEDA